MSVYVTDTHPLIYYFTNTHRQLSRRALRVFHQAEDAEAFIYVPAVVLWEVSILEKNGEIKLNEPYEDWADALLAQPGFGCAPLDECVVAEARAYGFNLDIFDIAIVATSHVL